MPSINLKIREALNSINQTINIKKFAPKIGIVCGSGLNELAEKIDSIFSLPYQEIKWMPKSTVSGHEGQFVFGYISKVPVVMMQGRIHMYEGYSTQDVVFPIRLMKKMGVEVLIVTNAAGGITFKEPGSLMLIKDHISLVPSPLIGPNADSFGDRFPDMTDAYDQEYRTIIKKIAKESNINLEEGVYMQFQGPQFETPAEVRFAKTIGADAVGMSTAVEVIAARHANMKVVGISCITNPAAGTVEGVKLDHLDVLSETKKANENLEILGNKFIKELKVMYKW